MFCSKMLSLKAVIMRYFKILRAKIKYKYLLNTQYLYGILYFWPLRKNDIVYLIGLRYGLFLHNIVMAILL